MFGTRRTGPGSADANLRFDRTADAAGLLAELDAFVQQNTVARARRSRLGWWAAGAIATLIFGTPTAFVVLGVIAALLSDTIDDLVSMLLVAGGTTFVGLTSLIAFIFFLARRGKVIAWDLDVDKLSIAHALVVGVGTDAAPRTPVHLYLDLAGLERAPATPTHHGGQLYRQHWLRVDARLIDGTSIRVDSMTQLKQKSRPKRKYTKTKEQLIDRMMIRLHSRRGTLLPPDIPSRIQPRFAYSSPRLVRATCVGPTAVLQLASYPYFRQRTRSGWSERGAECRLNPLSAVGATVRAYRAVTAARVGR